MSEALFEQSNLQCLMSFVDALAKAQAFTEVEFNRKLDDLRHDVEICKQQNSELRNEIAQITKDKEINTKHPDNSSINDIKNIEYLQDYLRELIKYKDKLAILIAYYASTNVTLVKNEKDLLHELGLRNKFDRSLRPYIALILNGRVWTEKESSIRGNIRDHIIIGNTTISLSSCYGVKGPCKMVINGNDYAVNSDGFNFVIAKSDDMKVIDSVAFDLVNYNCTRKKL